MVTVLLISAYVLWLSAAIERSYLCVMQADFLNELFSFPSQLSLCFGCMGAPSAVFHTPLQACYHLTNLTCRAGVVLLCDDLDATFSSREADFWFRVESWAPARFNTLLFYHSRC